MAVGDTNYYSGGKSVTVSLTSTVGKDQIAVVEGWVGVAAGSGDSGDDIALTVDLVEYEIQLPSGLGASKGDIIYIDTTDLTGHIPDSTAYALAGGANLVAAFKLTSDPDGNDVATGIFLGELAS